MAQQPPAHWQQRVLGVGRGCPAGLAERLEGARLRDLVEIQQPLACTATCFIAVVRLLGGGGGSGGGQPAPLGVLKSYTKTRCDELELKQVHLEVELHQQMQHRHVVPFWAAVEDVGQVHLLTEFFAQGDLRGMMGSPLAEATVRDTVVLPLLGVLESMHARGFVHRDLKPENVLVCGDRLMLGDYGLAVAVPSAAVVPTPSPTPPAAAQQQLGGGKPCGAMRTCSSSDSVSALASPRASADGGGGGCAGSRPGGRGTGMRRSSSYAAGFGDSGDDALLPHQQAGGTPAYSAPEIVQAAFNNTPVADVVGPANDVWALGVMTLELLAGRHPFGGPHTSPTAFMCNVVRSGALELSALPVSGECRDWLAAALQKDPAQRATARQLLRHAWAKAPLLAAACDGGRELPPVCAEPAAQRCEHSPLQGCTSEGLAPGGGVKIAVVADASASAPAGPLWAPAAPERPGGLPSVAPSSGSVGSGAENAGAGAARLDGGSRPCGTYWGRVAGGAGGPGAASPFPFLGAIGSWED